MRVEATQRELYPYNFASSPIDSRAANVSDRRAMAIYLIRHGETDSNAARVVQTPEAPLSKRGITQAGLLARRLAGEGITNVITSDLPRARITAEIVQATTRATLRLDALLQERNYGDIRGRAYADFDVDILGPDYEPPGGERWMEFHQRVDRAWVAITDAATRARGHLAVVTHGLVCASLAQRHLQLPAGVAAPQRWGNTSLTIIDTAPPYVVRLLNCTAHLDERSADDVRTRSGL
ncbi:MAG: histidine phosphatase family protein [Deltaproteobacteria bacterium]|nr:histidine phosphatase family protein [Deltaproteobacteria bacterium]MBI3387776.1 histidine phosphatase family protein [Deltaproteobacteria bacterium]